jgi:hypothetical protein
MRRLLPALILPALLAGCGPSREARIEAKLEQAGLKPKLARCMAPKLAGRLSTTQLETLADAAKRRPGDTNRVTLDQIAVRLQQSGDPEIVGIVGRAGFKCAILG